MTGPLITFILPFYNEQDYIAATIASLADQEDRRFALRLVDNASDDGSVNIARKAVSAMPDIDVQFMHEPRPGKLFALGRGCHAVETPLIGTLDADTLYPPAYVSRILREFERKPDTSVLLALHEDEGRGDGGAGNFKWLQVKLQPRHCHAGGCGQAFRRDAFENAGGFDPARWPYVLEDHEIVHQVSRFGPVRYRRDHSFRSSDRRDERASCSWSMVERLGYKLLPASAGRWYFRSVLAPRFARRGLQSITLREGAWRQDLQESE